MAARFVSEEGDLKGLVLQLKDGTEWFIGRDPDESVLIIPDPLVSRRHAHAYLKPDGIYLENLSHTNPIQVNDEEIDKPYLMRHGDIIKIGSGLFRYYTDPDAHVIDEELPSEVESPDETPALASEPIEPKPEPKPAEDDNFFKDLLDQMPEETEEPEIPQEKEEKMTEHNDTFDTVLQDTEEFPSIAEIDFGLAEAGRWLIKVIGGPNNGAEFYMQTGHSYVLGTDPSSCDIVFNDTSVSRQHAKITVSPEDELSIEDLKSRNGIMIAGKQVQGHEPLPPSTIVTIGTSSFLIYDREGEMQTIISPLLPSIVRILQGDGSSKTEDGTPTRDAQGIKHEEPAHVHEAKKSLPPKKNGSYIFIALLIGLFMFVGIGTAFLFKSEPIVTHVQENADELIQQAITPFPAVKFSFNKASGGLLLIGHVSTGAEKNQLLYNLQPLRFIKSVDDSGIIIDEGVWREINSVLTKNPAWKGITVHSPSAGEFILSGYLQTRKQADQLADYMSINFPYLDLLKKEIVVEEDVLNEINGWMYAAQMTGVTAKMSNTGEISLTGSVPKDMSDQIAALVTKVKSIPGVRMVNNFVKIKTPELSVINLSDQYEVTGQTKIGDHYTVIINGKILSDGDQLDGMTITNITTNTVFLKKGNAQYRIDYK